MTADTDTRQAAERVEKFLDRWEAMNPGHVDERYPHADVIYGLDGLENVLKAGDLRALIRAALAVVLPEESPRSNNPVFVDVVFDGPPAHKSGRFIETELPDGTGVGAGEWVDRDDGTWALRLPVAYEAVRTQNELKPQIIAEPVYAHELFGVPVSKEQYDTMQRDMVAMTERIAFTWSRIRITDGNHRAVIEKLLAVAHDAGYEHPFFEDGSAEFVDLVEQHWAAGTPRYDLARWLVDEAFKALVLGSIRYEDQLPDPEGEGEG